MSSVERNWQTTRPSIRERNAFMFNNDLFSDVKFVVHRSDRESESKQVIPAHKFVLSISSPVFEAMFYGELAETTDTIELPDCEYDSLLELFRYMYSDEANLNGSNVMGVMYLAKKYIVPSLADKCAEYLQDNLDPSNVFSILPPAQKFEEKNLVEQCWEVIDEQTEEAVNSDVFATIERSLLEAVVVRDSLTIEEIELFKAVDLWATRECERQGLAAVGGTKRRILEEKVIKGIRFPTMKKEDFTSVVLECEILTPKEIVSIVEYLNSIVKPPVGFPETKRPGSFREIHRCRRFRSSSATGWFYRSYSDKRDAINFSIDSEDIVLHGVCLFGNENSTYSVGLDLTNPEGTAVVASKTGTFSSELLQSDQSSYYGFKVLFDKKIILNKNTKYSVRALIVGSPSLYGFNCVSSVQCSGVTFTFENSRHPNTNGTTVALGQFAELLFSFKSHF